MHLTKNHKLIITSVLIRQLPKINENELNIFKLKKNEMNEAKVMAKNQIVMPIDVNYSKEYLTLLIKLTSAPDHFVSKINLMKFIQENLNCRTATMQLILSWSSTMPKQLLEKFFFDAIKSGNPEELDIFLKANVDFVNTKNEAGFNPLHLACLKEQNAINFVKVLLKYKTDINAIDKYGMPPLFYSFYTLNQSISKLLIESGAKLNFKINYDKICGDKDNNENITLVESLIDPPFLDINFVHTDIQKEIANFDKRIQFAQWLAKNYNFNINSSKNFKNDLIVKAINDKNFETLELLHALKADFNKTIKIKGIFMCYMQLIFIKHFGLDNLSSNTQIIYPEENYRLCEKLIEYGYKPKSHFMELKNQDDKAISVDQFAMNQFKNSRLMNMLTQGQYKNIYQTTVENQTITVCTTKEYVKENKIEQEFLPALLPYIELYVILSKVGTNLKSIAVPLCDATISSSNHLFEPVPIPTSLRKIKKLQEPIANETTINESSITKEAPIFSSTRLINEKINVPNETNLTDQKRKLIDSTLSNITEITKLIEAMQLTTQIPNWAKNINAESLLSNDYLTLQTLEDEVACWAAKTKNRLLLNQISPIESTVKLDPTTSSVNDITNINAIYAGVLSFTPELMITLRGSKNVAILLPFSHEKFGIESIFNAKDINPHDFAVLNTLLEDLTQLKINDEIVKFKNINSKCQVYINNQSKTYELFGELKIKDSEHRIALFVLDQIGQGPKLLIMGTFVPKGFHDPRYNGQVLQCGNFDFSEKRIAEAIQYYKALDNTCSRDTADKNNNNETNKVKYKM